MTQKDTVTAPAVERLSMMTLNSFVNNLIPQTMNFACECKNSCSHHEENDCSNSAKHKILRENSNFGYIFLCENCVENLEC